MPRQAFRPNAASLDRGGHAAKRAMSNMQARQGRALRRARLLAAGALVLLALAGCSYPKPVRTYEYVLVYDRMTDQFDPLVSLVYIAPDADLAAYERVIVDQFGVGRHGIEDQEVADR